MKKIPVEKIQNGMILAKDVCGRSGNVILGKGTPLNAQLGQRLKNWEIFFVFVEGEDEPMPMNAAAAPSAEVVRQRIEKKFAKVMHDPIMQQIFAAVYQFLINTPHE